MSPWRHLLMVLLLVGGAATAGAQERPAPVASPSGVVPDSHQDSVRLTRVTSAVMPADGLLTVGLRAHKSDTVLILNDFLARVDQIDVSLEFEAGLRPWLHVWASVPWRSWSHGQEFVPTTGSGLGDGRWQLVAGRDLGWDGFHLAFTGGGNIPLGDAASGLGEGVFSPQVGVAVTLVFWRDRTVPEMRLHFNAGRTWNRSEARGYGADRQRFGPWPPRYQAADVAGGPDRNDTRDLGMALEFRAGTTSLWVEYSEQMFRHNDTVSRDEQLRMIAAGLRWGLMSGWALHASYLVSLANDDEATAWWPGYPDLVTSVGVSRQFGWGGADRDGDGLVDRLDYCRDLAEDRDGFQDGDGCPDFDNDADGVPDTRDAAPDQPEDYDGFADGDGAPDPDNDGDGILDQDDLCPDVAEDFDGHADTDGCPDEIVDRDGDGVADAIDACPDTPEDRDGFDDDDGCPDLDNDLDGVPDILDKCPDQAEDYNGVADDDGCPEATGGGSGTPHV